MTVMGGQVPQVTLFTFREALRGAFVLHQSAHSSSGGSMSDELENFDVTVALGAQERLVQSTKDG